MAMTRMKIFLFITVHSVKFGAKVRKKWAYSKKSVVEMVDKIKSTVSTDDRVTAFFPIPSGKRLLNSHYPMLEIFGVSFFPSQFLKQSAL